MGPGDARRLEVLLATPMPPPNHGGIANWTRIVSKTLGTRPELALRFVDTMPRHRAVINTSMLVRCFGGSAQALRDSYRIYREMKHHRPDLLHLCTSGGPATLKDVLILSTAKRMGIRSIIHYRMGRLPGIAARGGVEWRLTRRAMALASAVILLDRGSKAVVEQSGVSSRVVQLPNIVEIDTVDAIRASLSAATGGQEQTRVVFVGHVIPTKGIRELVEACVGLPQHNVLLEIVGPVGSAFRATLQAIAQRRDDGRFLRLPGAVDHDQALRHLAAADLFVLPSYTEGAPNVILEAMAAGRAILSTSVGAVPEMLDIGGPDECGVCVEPRDVEALSKALDDLLGDEPRREELGRKARQRAENVYAVPVACERLLDLWKSVAK